MLTSLTLLRIREKFSNITMIIQISQVTWTPVTFTQKPIQDLVKNLMFTYIIWDIKKDTEKIVQIHI